MSSSPVFSVIIPVYNDPDGLRQTLSSFVDQHDNPEFEIIVVDNDSTDSTPDVISEFEEKYPGLVFGYLETDIQSSYAARNTGIQHASGEVLAFIDADVTVGERWVADISEKFRSSSVDYLGCNVEMYVPNGEDSIWARYDVAMGLSMEHYLKTKQFAPTCALVIRREVIEQVGSFDETLVSGGDKEFGNRAAKEGFTMEYSASLKVRHPARTTFQSLVNKSKRIGKGQTQLWRKYDLAAHPLSVGRILPPSPERVRSRLEGENSFFVIFLIEWLLKTVQTISGISVLISQDRS